MAVMGLGVVGVGGSFACGGAPANVAAGVALGALFPLSMTSGHWQSVSVQLFLADEPKQTQMC